MIIALRKKEQNSYKVVLKCSFRAKNLSTKSRRNLSEGFFFAGEVFLAKKLRQDFVDEEFLI